MGPELTTDGADDVGNVSKSAAATNETATPQATAITADEFASRSASITLPTMRIDCVVAKILYMHSVFRATGETDVDLYDKIVTLMETNDPNSDGLQASFDFDNDVEFTVDDAGKAIREVKVCIIAYANPIYWTRLANIMAPQRAHPKLGFTDAQLLVRIRTALLDLGQQDQISCAGFALFLDAFNLWVGSKELDDEALKEHAEKLLKATATAKSNRVLTASALVATPAPDLDLQVTIDMKAYIDALRKSLTESYKEIDDQFEAEPTTKSLEQLWAELSEVVGTPSAMKLNRQIAAANAAKYRAANNGPMEKLTKLSDKMAAHIKNRTAQSRYHVGEGGDGAASNEA